MYVPKVLCTIFCKVLCSVCKVQHNIIHIHSNCGGEGIVCVFLSTCVYYIVFVFRCVRRMFIRVSNTIIRNGSKRRRCTVCVCVCVCVSRCVSVSLSVRVCVCDSNNTDDAERKRESCACVRIRTCV